jgi:hypothetical protein
MAQRMRRRSIRRRAPTSRRSRIKRRARKTAKSGFSIGRKIFPIAKNIAAPVAFIEQISAKHRQTLGTAYTSAPIGQKLKILTNIVTGSTTGMNFFKDEFQAPLSQLKVSNILPAQSPIKSIGKQILIGGGIGGLLDDKPTTNTASRGTANIMPETAMQQMYTSGFQGNDSTLSGLN